MLGTTLQRHILAELHGGAKMPQDLADLIAQIAAASKVLAREMRRAALVGQLGLVGDRNATGDAQKKLDVYSHQVVLDAFAHTGLVAGIVSEEAAELYRVEGGRDARYILCIDPLDGSSNCDVNGPVGTIFGVHLRTSTHADAETDLLANGAELVAAGYIMYGPSTIFAYTSGRGAHAFTLDDLGEYVLSQKDIRCPERGHYYSANLGNLHQWDPGVRRYIEHVQSHDPGQIRPYSLRYAGALVADVHRILCEGGIYLYPPGGPKKEGKLRLFYECLPLAFVVEQAGGRASTGRARIAEVAREGIHQRVPLYIGSAGDVADCERFIGK
ncbi:MAG: class 1 fructose-bisphosphatase [Planctomycetes bacterium]|nr:class 1 fructose-bisphosphatase [Planctomycetota bacterium]